MRSVRIWFEKNDRAIYTSHLDLNRCMTRAVRRAGIPLWYTEGFNPHPYLMFPMPLSLGQGSDGEPMDIRIDGEMTDAEIFTALSSVMPEGFVIKSVGEPRDKAADIAMAEYDITLTFIDGNDIAEIVKKISALIDSGELTAEKAGKKGNRKVVKEIRLCELTHRFAIEYDGTKIHINAVLAAGSTLNLNPSLLLQKAAEFDPICTEIRRKRLLKSDFLEFA